MNIPIGRIEHLTKLSPNENRIPPSRHIRVIVALAMMVILSEISLSLRLPLLFPSIGPTAIAVISRPAMKSNRPTAIVGTHFFGVAVALALLYLFGLYGAPSTLQVGFTQSRAAVVALSMGITTIFEENTPLYHPPAAATTLLVSLGVIATPLPLISIIIGVLLITIGAAIYEYLCPKVQPKELEHRVAKNVVT